VAFLCRRNIGAGAVAEGQPEAGVLAGCAPTDLILRTLGLKQEGGRDPR
jgi:hypothetical protein